MTFLCIRFSIERVLYKSWKLWHYDIQVRQLNHAFAFSSAVRRQSDATLSHGIQSPAD